MFNVRNGRKFNVRYGRIFNVRYRIILNAIWQNIKSYNENSAISYIKYEYTAI